MKETAGVGQPEGRHLEVLVVFLQMKRKRVSQKTLRVDDPTGGREEELTLRTFLMELMVEVSRDSTFWSSLM